MLEVATRMLSAGLSVLPAVTAEKRPAVSEWKPFQSRLPAPSELKRWFESADGVCLICGSVSGNLEMIDFDFGGELYPLWSEMVNDQFHGLLDQLVIEQSQSGGKHVIYRCAEQISGNVKLAQRLIRAPDEKPITLAGKLLTPRRRGDAWTAIATMIETRGEGGLFLCAPTPGYSLINGDLAAPPTITAAQRDALLSYAHSLNELVEERQIGPQTSQERPGDAYNRQADVRPLLRKHGWTQVRGGPNEYWRRPGKSAGWSATLRTIDGVPRFFCHSSNAHPFEAGKGYAPYQILALLEHNGDFVHSAAALRSNGFGSPTVDHGVDLSEFEPEPAPPVTYKFPPTLLDVPGFIGDVVAYNLATAPRPQPVLALAGAIALQGVLAARKIRDRMDNRTNLFIVCLASSGHGKGHARKVARKILFNAGLAKLEAPSKIASDAALIGVLADGPARLLQMDEFGRYLSTMSSAVKSPHLFNIVTTMMELYSEADGVYYGKAYAEKKKNVEIDQPCLCLNMVASTDSFHRALTIDNLRDGSLARMLVIEPDDELPDIQEVEFVDPPSDLIDVAKAWGRFTVGGNLQDEHPTPIIAEETASARKILSDLSAKQQAQMTSTKDDWRQSVWARMYEKARRLALCYACSTISAQIGEGEVPVVDESAATWACELAEHLTRRLIQTALDHVSEGQFHEMQQRISEIIRRAGGQATRHRLTRGLQRIDPRLWKPALDAMIEGGSVQVLAVKPDGAGREATVYVMRETEI